MLSSVATVVLLAVVWWLAIHAAEWWTLPVAHGRQDGAASIALARYWPAHALPAHVRTALANADVARLETYYNQWKNNAIYPAADNCDGPGGTLAEALVSVTLAEAMRDCAKAFGGLEAVAKLRRVCPGSSNGDGTRAALDVMEARLRLVLAHEAADPRQRHLAMAALDRAETAAVPLPQF